MEGMDHVNEDSFMTDESIEEQRETTATGTDEGEALYDPAEITSVEESQESQTETAPQLEVSTYGNFLWNTKCCKMHIFLRGPAIIIFFWLFCVQHRLGFSLSLYSQFCLLESPLVN